MLNASAVERRINALKKELSDVAPYSFTDGKHLDAGTPERAYGHQGYLSAMTDLVSSLAKMESALVKIAGASYGSLPPDYGKDGWARKEATIDVAAAILELRSPQIK